jgi:hypothetical protein
MNYFISMIPELVIFGVIAIFVSFLVSYVLTGKYVNGSESWNREKSIFITSIISFIVFQLYSRLFFSLK